MPPLGGFSKIFWNREGIACGGLGRPGLGVIDYFYPIFQLRSGAGLLLVVAGGFDISLIID
jgi:hypothetical protein